MSINGLLIIDQGGIPIYTKIVEIDIQIDPLLISSFLSAIQSFAQEIENDTESYINEMNLQNFKIIYRRFDLLTFIGIIDYKKDTKEADLILEYLIWAFFSKFRPVLQSANILEVSQFEIFDNIFLKFNHSKEKELKKWLEKSTLITNLLQGILNKLIDYFPIQELIKINPNKLIIIGKKLLMVSLNITADKEHVIMDELRRKTSLIYGPQLFESILKELKTTSSTSEIF